MIDDGYSGIEIAASNLEFFFFFYHSGTYILPWCSHKGVKLFNFVCVTSSEGVQCLVFVEHLCIHGNLQRD